MTSMMRQRALQKKLAKVNMAVKADADNKEQAVTNKKEADAKNTPTSSEDVDKQAPTQDKVAEESAKAPPAKDEASKPDAPVEAKAPLSAKALARQRLLKKKQKEAEKKASESNSEAGDADDQEEMKRLAAEAERAKKEKAEEIAKKKAEEEARKLKEARMKGGVELLQAAMSKILQAAMSKMLMSWVDNFGEDLALMELAEEELNLEAEVEAEMAEEELDAELELLTSQLQGEGTAEASSPEDLQEELRTMREKCLHHAQDAKQMKSRIRELETEVQTATKKVDEEKKKADDHLRNFKMTNQELSTVQRQLLEAKCEVSAAKKGSPATKGSSATRRKAPPTCSEAEMEDMLADANRDLAAAQRQVLELKQKLDKAERGAGSARGDGSKDKEVEKLKKSVANTNKELSEAQYAMLAKREQFKEVDTLFEELDSLVDTKDRKLRKVMNRIREKIDEALDEEDEEES